MKNDSFTKLTTLLLIALAQAAVAQTYNFTFAGNDGINATGTISILGGVAQSGSIYVTGVPLEANPSIFTTAAGDLLTAGGDVRNHDGDVITYDTFANASNDPIFSNTGVAFGSGPYQDSTHFNTLINLWGNGPGSYGMFIGEANPASLEPDGTLVPGTPHSDVQWVYVYNEPGTLILTPVPEPTTAGCFLLGLGAWAGSRRLKKV
jgi:hypothetical protein